MLLNLKPFKKGFVKATTFTTKKGTVVHRKAFTDKRVAKTHTASNNARLTWKGDESFGGLRDRLHSKHKQLLNDAKETLKHHEAILEAKKKGDTHSSHGIKVADHHHVVKHLHNLHQKLEDSSQRIMQHQNYNPLAIEKREEQAQKNREKRQALKNPEKKVNKVSELPVLKGKPISIKPEKEEEDQTDYKKGDRLIYSRHSKMLGKQHTMTGHYQGGGIVKLDKEHLHDGRDVIPISKFWTLDKTEKQDMKKKPEIGNTKTEIGNGKTKSDSMLGNKNAYKGGPKDEPKKPKLVVPTVDFPEKKEEEEKTRKSIPLEDFVKLTPEEQEKALGSINEAEFQNLSQAAAFLSKKIDEVVEPERLKLNELDKKDREAYQDLRRRRVRRNSNEYKKHFEESRELSNKRRKFNIEVSNRKSEYLLSMFPALEKITSYGVSDLLGGRMRHGEFIRKLEEGGVELSTQNKRDYLLGDQKNWLTDKAIKMKPEEYAEKLGVNVDNIKEIPRDFGQHLLAKFTNNRFFSGKQNIDFDDLLENYWIKNKAKYSGKKFEVQKDEFKPKVTKDENSEHYDYSKDDHGFSLPDISTAGFTKFTKKELEGEGHELVQRAAKEFEELKKSLIKSERLEKNNYKSGYIPFEYKIEGGYQVVNGNIFLRAAVSQDKYWYKEKPDKRPKKRSSFLYSPDIQIGSEGMLELKGGWKAEIEVQRQIHNKMNDKNTHSTNLLSDISNKGGSWGSHKFFQEAEYDEKTGLINCSTESQGRGKVSASMPLARFKMMLSFYNSSQRGFGGGYVVPEKNLTASVKEAMNILKADQDANRERLSSTYYESYLKGRETSFGTKNIENDLVDSHGVFIKRQNGDTLSTEDKEALTKVIDETYTAIGNKELLSKTAKGKKLKVSFSGERMAFLTKAVGLYVPAEGTIVIGPQMAEVLPHEFAHFMDDNLGDETKKGRGSYASEMQHTSIGQLTILGRRLFSKKSKRTQAQDGYWNRSCEVFARMVEQYAAVNHYKNESYYGKDGYWTKEKYDQIKPEIEKVLMEKFGKSFRLLFRI